ncbi:MAG: methyltransferase domain-containing protein [Chitinophagaceae bacterium]
MNKSKLKTAAKKILKFLKPKINFGDLDRTSPLSTAFGYDRGGPVDRYYIENFLKSNASLIKGRVLEIGDNEYTLKYGGAQVTQSDIFHVDETNTAAAYTGDISNAPHVPDNLYDCIICTQTLQLIYDYKGAIATCHRILKPGGSLIITVPGLSHVAQDIWGEYWLWSFTSRSIRLILGEQFKEEKVKLQTFGNVLVATAFLYGIGLPEISKKKMEVYDKHYQLIIAGIATK